MTRAWRLTFVAGSVQGCIANIQAAPLVLPERITCFNANGKPSDEAENAKCICNKVRS